MSNLSLWSKTQKELFAQFTCSQAGISSREAKERLEKEGYNSVPEKDRRAWLDILLSQFASPLVQILMAASLLSIFLGDTTGALIILAIIAASSFFGFLQEYKSEKTLSELKKYLSHGAVALRDGQKGQIDSRELVEGDIVFVGMGDIVPADLRILETRGISADESVLTGESREVQKNSLDACKNCSTPQEIKNGLFMGTTITEGYAKALVIATGKNTFFGKTVSVFSSKVPESDFQIGIRKFGDLLIRIIIILSVFVFLTNYALGHGEKNPLVESLIFSLAIAVGIAPEALPAIVTIALSNGSMALAKHKVITKKLAAIEDLGNMDVLCTDKTGTLTEELRVEKYIDLDEKDSHDLLEYALLCNSSVGSTVRIRGNSVDVAIKKYAIKMGEDVSRFKKIQELPFDFQRRRMGQVVQEGKKTYLIVKGGVESIISACTKVELASGLYSISSKKTKILKMVRDYSMQGYTVIAVAYKDIEQSKGLRKTCPKGKQIEKKKEYSKEDEKGLIFIGFIMLHNPPKHTVKQTLERLKKLNIRLKVLTGDDPLVTKKLCFDIGFVPYKNRVVLGSELENISLEKLSEMAEKFDVFARVTPQQKLAIIEALRERKHVVGYLGDGINDAPSLRAADVGISVNTAADVAKGASHIILLQKSLSVICDGVEEGRKTFANITKYILNTMSANQGNMITVGLSSLFLPFIPMLPAQILFNNLISDLPMFCISRDNVDKESLQKPQRWNTDFILKFMLFFGVISTLFDLLFICVLYFILNVGMDAFRTAWFLESVLSEIIIVFSLRTSMPFFKSIPAHLLIASSIIGAAVAIGSIYFTPVASLLRFVPLSAELLAFTAVTLVAYFALTEIGKRVFYSRFAKAHILTTPKCIN